MCGDTNNVDGMVWYGRSKYRINLLLPAEPEPPTDSLVHRISTTGRLVRELKVDIIANTWFGSGRLQVQKRAKKSTINQSTNQPLTHAIRLYLSYIDWVVVCIRYVTPHRDLPGPFLQRCKHTGSMVRSSRLRFSRQINTGPGPRSL